ncbi:MAG: ATP-binding cassette domain-containing protein [Synergistaceae bacterium]|jgi:ribose transport system ATP-binding protein|nr:ATP-binding cassette domain-containing protein [Synergistaceae bacterium]
MLKRNFDAAFTRHAALLGLIILLCVFFSVVSNGFFSFNTAMNICRQASAIALAGTAMTMIMIIGGIDLSVGAVIALSGMTGAIVMERAGSPGLGTAMLGFLTTVLTAVGFGALNGFLTGYLKMAPFIVTLATMSLARGITLTISDSNRVLVNNDHYVALAWTNLFGRIPVSIILVLAVYIFMHLVLTRTTFGRKIYAVGDNPVAARVSGIDVRKQTMLTYAVSGIFISLATLVIVGRARSAQPLAGVNMEFDVITAVVIGGTSLLGGQGSLRGTLLGVFLTSIIFTGLSMIDLMPYVNYIVKGGLILFAVLSNRLLAGRHAHAEGERARHGGSSDPQAAGIIAENRQRTLTLRGIHKSFPGVRALDDVSLELRRGSVHALCGENGAGKSTLIKILSGVYQKDGGDILVDEHPVRIRTPHDSEKLGIAVIYQELANVPELNVSQNISLGHEIRSKLGFAIDVRRMNEKARDLLKRFKLDLPVTRKMDRLTVGQQQMVEIAKAYASNAWVVVMDEPTSAITEADKKNLFKIISELKANDIAVVYISHRLSEIFEIADEVTVLRDGKRVITGPVGDFDEYSIIRHMVGRELSDIFDRKKTRSSEPVLRVDRLERKGVFEPISFEVRKGEVLGFCGLMGAGRTEIMRCIYGLDRPDGGAIYVDGGKVVIRDPTDALSAGIAMVSEDRRREGIIPHLSVACNITLSTLDSMNRLGWINEDKDKSVAEEYIKSLSIRTPSPEQEIQNLSGGNQQKACLARGLNCKPKVIILDEPTRGIDVGAKAEIHKLIDRLTEEGIAIIMISSEMPEIIGASDRIITLYEGAFMGEFSAGERVTQEELMQCTAGVPKNMAASA